MLRYDVSMTSDASPQDGGSLRAFLAERDTPCPGCGYNLRGLAGDRCPECNQGLVLGVQLQDAAWGTLVGTIVALSIVAGIAGVMLAVVVSVSIATGRGPNEFLEAAMLIVYPLVALLITGVPAALLARPRGRAWFRAKAVADRRVLLVVAIAVAVSLVGCWFIIVLFFA